MDWKDFHKLNVIYKFMDDLEADFPSRCTTSIIGKSVEGLDIKVGDQLYSIILLPVYISD